MWCCVSRLLTQKRVHIPPAKSGLFLFCRVCPELRTVWPGESIFLVSYTVRNMRHTDMTKMELSYEYDDESCGYDHWSSAYDNFTWSFQFDQWSYLSTNFWSYDYDHSKM